MTHSRFSLHFSHLPLVQKVFYTCVLCVLGVGYLFAMIYIFASHHGRDGNDMLSVQDIIIAYSGSKSDTKLESALRGSMSGMLDADENIKIIGWAREGAEEDLYDSDIKEIFENRCITCHNNRNPHLPSLENYEKVKLVLEEDHGMNLFTLVRVSHIHLFGLTFIFFLMGGIFMHTYLRKEWVKIAIIATPFVAIIFDIASWYMTKVYEPFAWVVIGSGALIGLSFAVQFFLSIYQMWFYKLPQEVEQTFYCSVIEKSP